MPEPMTEAQRDGRACVRCGRDKAPMVPAGTIEGCQVFVCEDGIACAAAAEQLPPGPASDGASERPAYNGGETDRWEWT